MPVIAAGEADSSGARQDLFPKIKFTAAQARPARQAELRITKTKLLQRCRPQRVISFYYMERCLPRNFK